MPVFLIIFRRFALLALAISVASVMVVWANDQWREEQKKRAIIDRQVKPEDVQYGLLQSELAHIVAKHIIYTFPLNKQKAEEAINHAIQLDPLNAVLWIDRAELQIRHGDIEKGIQSANVARQLWPTRGPALWRVATIFSRLGATDLALEALQRYFAAHPYDVARAITLAQHLVNNERDVFKVLKESIISSQDADSIVFFRRVLLAAMRFGKHELVDEIWWGSSEVFRADRKNQFIYFDHLMEHRLFEKAEALWSNIYPNSRYERGIFNGDFEDPIANGGFGWVTNVSPLFEIKRDNQHSYSGDHSIKVDFFGQANIKFWHLSQLINVKHKNSEDGASVKVGGMWRGQDVTTRTGPYMELIEYYVDEPNVVRSEQRVGSWSWTKFELALAVKPDTEFVLLRLRRNETTDFDNKLSGQVWLDAIELKNE